MTLSTHHTLCDSQYTPHAFNTTRPVTLSTHHTRSEERGCEAAAAWRARVATRRGGEHHMPCDAQYTRVSRNLSAHAFLASLRARVARRRGGEDHTVLWRPVHTPRVPRILHSVIRTCTKLPRCGRGWREGVAVHTTRFVAPSTHHPRSSHPALKTCTKLPRCGRGWREGVVVNTTRPLFLSGCTYEA